MKRYEAVETTTMHVGSTLEKLPKLQPTMVQLFLTFLITMWFGMIFYFGKMGIAKCNKAYKEFENSKFDPWDYAAKSGNCLIMTKLCDRESGKRFVLATYHMPCAYWAPKVITIHTCAVMKLLTKYAENLPIIFPCDCNFKPNSFQYDIFTTGKINPFNNEYPDIVPTSWPPVLEAFSSSYKKIDGNEPKFTVKTFTKRSEQTFSETLDYIFYFGDISPVSVTQISQCEDIIPNEIEHSDHFALQASLQ